MEKNGSGRPMAMYQKISKAVSDYPAFRAIRRISSREQEPRPASPAPKPLQPPPTPVARTLDIQPQADSPKLPKSVEVSRRQKVPQKKEAAGVIPIGDASSNQLPRTERLKTTSSLAPNEKNTPQVTKVTSKIEPEPAPRNISAMRSNFKVELPDDKQGNKTEANIEDSFTDYIKRARKKISRTISNIGDGLKMGRSTSNIGDARTSSGKDKFTDYIESAKMRMGRTSSIDAGNYSSNK